MTEIEARRAILDAFWIAWKTHAPVAARTSSIPVVQWEDQEPTEPADPSKSWARVTVKHGPSAQRSLGDGLRRFERTGLVIVQAFSPRDARGCETSLALATVAKNAFEGKSTQGIWFRNCRAAEVGPDKGWYQSNAIAEFNYDDVK